MTTLIITLMVAIPLAILANKVAKAAGKSFAINGWSRGLFCLPK